MSISAFALILFFSRELLAAQPPAIAPSPYIEELQKEFFELARAQPDAMALLNACLARSKSASPADFFSMIHTCDEQKSRTAAVSQTVNYQYTYLGRVLEEPESANNEALKEYYLKRHKAELVNAPALDSLSWDIGPDIITIRYRDNSQRQICLKPGVRPNQAAEAIAHEMYHYVNLAENPETVDVLRFKDADDYANQTVLNPGDEVDAYAFQFSLRIKQSGKSVLGNIPAVAKLFSDDGRFLGPREELASYVLNTLEYRKNRFQEEYEALVRLQLREAEDRLNVHGELLKTRLAQESELGNYLKERYRILNLLWPSYRAATDRAAGLLRTATSSKERLSKNIESLKARQSELQSRVAALGGNGQLPPGSGQINSSVPD